LSDLFIQCYILCRRLTVKFSNSATLMNASTIITTVITVLSNTAVAVKYLTRNIFSVTYQCYACMSGT